MRSALLSVALPGCLALGACAHQSDRNVVEQGTVPVPGSLLAYDVRGSGPAVVFVHGGGFDRRLWAGQVDEFARNFLVITYDVRGAGKSGRSDTGPFRHHEDLAVLLAHLGVERVSIVGQSLGGRIAFDLALTHPRLVDRIVAVGPGLSGWPWAQANFGAWIEIMREGGLKRDTTLLVRGWLASGYMQAAAERPELKAIVERYARENTRTWLENSDEPELDPPALKRLEQIRAKTLIVVGSRDEQVILEIADSLMARLPDARREIIPGVGHAPNLEDPERFNRIALAFLRSRE